MSISVKIQIAEEICLKKGLKLTPLRRDVLGLIVASDKPVKAYDLIRKMSKPGEPLQPPTVYRALDFLMAAGLVHKIESLNAFVCCTEPGHDHHEHFLVCGSCSKVEEFRPKDYPHMESKIGSFSIDHAVTEFRGTCADCQHHTE